MGKIECERNCTCKNLCHSRPERKQEALRIDLNNAPQFIVGKRFQKVCNGLPDRYIPEVKPYPDEMKKAIELTKKTGFKSLLISFSHFLTKKGKFNREFFKVKKAGGLHNYLNFNGKIVLVTDLLDTLCDALNVERLCISVTLLKPDYITTFDTYYYDDQPMFITQIKMLETLQKTVALYDKLDVPVIGLAVGPSNELFKWYTHCLIKLGCKILAIPCFESRSRGSKKSGVKKIAKRILMVKDIDSEAQILLLSCSPSRPRAYGADYYSSYSAWWIMKGKNANQKRMEKLEAYKKVAKEYSKQKLVHENGWRSF